MDPLPAAGYWRLAFPAGLRALEKRDPLEKRC
jgi:hypothetical protein